MKPMSINISAPPSTIFIGITGENEYRPIEFDVSSWLATYPDGLISIIFKRPDGEIYPVIENAAASPITWLPDATALSVAGRGQIEARISGGGTIGKSCIIETITRPGLNAGDTPPDAVVEWVQKILDTTGHVPTIGENGNWWIWDIDTGAYVDTGLPAQGEDGKTAYESAVEGGYVGTEEEFNLALSDVSKLEYSSLKLRISQTLTEAVSAITLSQGDDEQPLNGIVGKLRIVVPAGCSAPTGEKAVVYAQFNDIVSGYYNQYVGSDDYSNITIGYVRNLMASITCDLDVIGSTLSTRQTTFYSDGVTRGSTTFYGGNNSFDETIEKLYFFIPTYTMPAGTIIEYWEVRA